MRIASLLLLAAVCAAASMLASPRAQAQPAPGAAAPSNVRQADAIVIDARDALRRKDRARLSVLRGLAEEAQHPLAGWVAYWELTNRLPEAGVEEVEAFYGRYAGSYVEDRLRNDFLLELGRRGDWAAFQRDFPRFRMNDDRSVTCYSLWADHAAGKDVRNAALAAWLAQDVADTACHGLARTLVDAGRLDADEVWRKLRGAVATGRLRVAQLAASLLEPALAKRAGEALDSPAKTLVRLGNSGDSGSRLVTQELAAIAIARIAASDPAMAAEQLRSRWASDLSDSLAAWAWAVTGKEAAMDLQADAASHFDKAWDAVKRGRQPDWGDEALAWSVRAALRNGRGNEHWKTVRRAVGAMSMEARRDPAWIYWDARALMALSPKAEGRIAPAAEARPASTASAPPTAPSSPAASGASAAAAEPVAEPPRSAAQAQLEAIAGPFDFYGLLALEALAQPVRLPTRPALLAAAEREAAKANRGFARALQLIAIGLRNEGVREWNFALRGLNEREQLAAAQLACDREVWDRCINTSERTRNEIDIAQRYPMPFRSEVVEKSRAIDLDPAYVYGLIRQESRFIMDARSAAGASGLMQLMPATARLTARRMGMPFRQEMLNDRDVNLQLGTAYLKQALDDFGGSQALAAAAYNAGPGRPRKWREGPVIEAAIWAENIPFNETRDYVKKVLANATVYAAVLGLPRFALQGRLGKTVGPRPAGEGVPDE
jgi:soluble lytic murein transglycosylase